MASQTEREPQTHQGEPGRPVRETNEPPVIPPTEPQPVPVDEPHEIGRASRLDRIARRASQIHETRGGGPERRLSDWLQAEREIDLTD